MYVNLDVSEILLILKGTVSLIIVLGYDVQPLTLIHNCRLYNLHSFIRNLTNSFARIIEQNFKFVKQKKKMAVKIWWTIFLKLESVSWSLYAWLSHAFLTPLNILHIYELHILNCCNSPTSYDTFNFPIADLNQIALHDPVADYMTL